MAKALVKAMNEVTVEVNRLKKVIGARSLKKAQVLLTVQGLAGGKAEVILHHRADYLYSNNHTHYATAQRTVANTLATGVTLKEACELARAYKEQLAGHNVTAPIKFKEYEEFYAF